MHPVRNRENLVQFRMEALDGPKLVG